MNRTSSGYSLHTGFLYNIAVSTSNTASFSRFCSTSTRSLRISVPNLDSRAIQLAHLVHVNVRPTYRHAICRVLLMSSLPRLSNPCRPNNRPTNAFRESEWICRPRTKNKTKKKKKKMIGLVRLYTTS